MARLIRAHLFDQARGFARACAASLPRTPRFARGLIHVTAAAARLVAIAAARHDEAAAPVGARLVAKERD